MSTARRAERPEHLCGGIEFWRIGSKPAQGEVNVRNGVRIVMLRTLPIVDRGDNHSHRGEGLVEKGVFITPNVLARPSPAMDIEECGEWAWPLWLVDGDLECPAIHAQVVHILHMDGNRLAGRMELGGCSVIFGQN